MRFYRWVFVDTGEAYGPDVMAEDACRFYEHAMAGSIPSRVVFREGGRHLVAQVVKTGERVPMHFANGRAWLPD